MGPMKEREREDCFGSEKVLYVPWPQNRVLRDSHSRLKARARDLCEGRVQTTSSPIQRAVPSPNMSLLHDSIVC